MICNRWHKQLLGRAFSVYVALVALLCALVTCPLLLTLPGADRRRRVARFGTRMIFVLGGIRLRVAGRENLPDGPCIIVANHRSYFDGSALIAALPPGFSPVIKAAVERVPVLGRVMDRAGSVYVRRRPAHAAGVDTRALIRRTRAGISPAMFAEGTLSPDRGLLPLREGAFLVAAKTGLPVVPVAVTGTDGILPSGGRRLRFGAAAVIVGPPQRAAGSHRADARQLRDAVEPALWRLLSPATGDWRQTLTTEAYYRRVFQHVATPLAYLDIDELTRVVREKLRALRVPALRLDARALAYSSIGARVWRSDVRFVGLLVTDVSQAIEWLTTGEFADAIVEDGCDPATLARAAAWQRRQGGLSFAVRTSAAIDAIDRAAIANATVLPVIAHLPASEHPTNAAAPAALVEACQGRAGISLRGVLAGEDLRGADGATGNERNVALTAHDRGEQTMHTTFCDAAGRIDYVVGRELFEDANANQGTRAVLAFWPSATAATPEYVRRTGLDLVSVYGGAIVASAGERTPAGQPRFKTQPAPLVGHANVKDD